MMFHFECGAFCSAFQIAESQVWECAFDGNAENVMLYLVGVKQIYLMINWMWK